MTDLKEVRIKSMERILVDLISLKHFYLGGSPAWVLIHAAYGHIKSTHYLEAVAGFDPQTLGALEKPTNSNDACESNNE